MRFKNILNRLSQWVFVGITFLGFIIWYAGIDAENSYFVLLGSVLLIPSIIMIFYINKEQKKINKKQANRIRNLKTFGDKILVDLDSFKIIANKYNKEIEVGSGYRTRNEKVFVDQSVVMASIAYKDEILKFKLNLDMEITKVKMHFAIKDTTELYVDPLNTQNNYLDLDFLYN